MTWVIAAVSAAGAITSGVEANQSRQRNKGIISQAYALGAQRLNLNQQDTRESQAESLGARGLAQGGGVRDLGPIGPQTGASPVSVGGAHDLGSQAGLDEQREQQLEQTGLKQESQNELSANNAAADASEIGSGISAAGDIAAGAIKSAPVGVGPSASASPGSLGLGSGGGVPAPQMASSPYANAWGGIDPISPTTRGTWSGGNLSTTDFNKYGNGSP